MFIWFRVAFISSITFRLRVGFLSVFSFRFFSLWMVVFVRYVRFMAGSTVV